MTNSDQGIDTSPFILYLAGQRARELGMDAVHAQINERLQKLMPDGLLDEVLLDQDRFITASELQASQSELRNLAMEASPFDIDDVKFGPLINQIAQQLKFGEVAAVFVNVGNQW